jgi:hypothetical protein
MAETTGTSSSSGSKTTAKTTKTEEEEQALSSQAHFSTYSEDTDVDTSEMNPPPGKFVTQERGTPSEGPVTPPPTPTS